MPIVPHTAVPAAGHLIELTENRGIATYLRHHPDDEG